MNFSDFLRIERDDPDGSRHFVIHAREPMFSLELTPDTTAPDRVGRGIIRRVCVPNSWAGDYAQYSRFISAAQEFFAECSAPPAPPGGTPRFAR